MAEAPSAGSAVASRRGRRQGEEERMRRELDSLPREELVQRWYDLREEYNDRCLKSTTPGPASCVMCARLYRRTRQGDRGKGCRFYRDSDGSFIGECGGGVKIGPCPGMRILPENYIDSTTVHQEVRIAKDELLRELKHIRDRVFATETITPEDDADFKNLTREYRGIRKMEEAYTEARKNISYTGTAYIVEDGRPETEGGANVESVMFRSNKIRRRAKKGTESFDTGDMVLNVVCKEDLPVRL